MTFGRWARICVGMDRLRARSIVWWRGDSTSVAELVEKNEGRDGKESVVAISELCEFDLLCVVEGAPLVLPLAIDASEDFGVGGST